MIPRSPVPLKAPEIDYEKETIAILRKECPKLAEFTDGELAVLWEWHSCEFWCAGWMTHARWDIFMHYLKEADPAELIGWYKDSERIIQAKKGD